VNRRKSETRRKEIYKYTKADFLIFFGIITAIIFIFLAITGTFEKLGLNVNLMDNDFVTKLKKPGKQSSAASEKKLSKTALQEQELAKLEIQVRDMKARLGTNTAKTYNSLDTMLAIVREKEDRAKPLKELKRKHEAELEAEEQKRLAAIKRLRMEHDRMMRKSISEDLRKYEEIVSSEYGKEMEGAAWHDLVSRYPKAKDLETGNILNIRRVIIPRTILRSSYSTLSENDVKSMINEYKFFESSWNKNEGFYNSYFELEYDGKNRDKIVIDYASGLMWHQNGSSKPMNMVDAAVWLRMLNRKGHASFKNWRLPTLEEASSLLKSSKSNTLYIDPAFSKKQNQIWTGDSETGSESTWCVSFQNGFVRFINSDISEICYVRPVRNLSYK